MAHIESVQTVIPFKITNPRPTLQVSAAENSTLFEMFRNCLHILFYYTKASQEDTRWLHTGWIKESLARALLDQPLFAGRFIVNDSGEMEIVGNDSGIRLIESRAPMTQKTSGGVDAEDVLVFWKAIDEQCTRYSPLIDLFLFDKE